MTSWFRSPVRLLALSVLLGVGCGGVDVAAPLPAQSEPLLPVQHWQSLFDTDAAVNAPESEHLSLSSDSSDFYPLAYSIDALASMFEATGDFGYARGALHYTLNMMASARPSTSLPSSSFKDSYLGWVSAANENDETPLYESYAWRYVARTLRLLQPVLDEAPADIRVDYFRVLVFTETNIIDKWRSRGANEYIYRERTHMAAHWASIALDISRLTADPARQAACTEIVSNIDDHLPNFPSSLRQQLHPGRTDPAGYWWSDVWGETTGPGQDIGHGNGDIAYVVESHDIGGSWSDLEVAHFAHTLTRLIANTGTRYPEFVDGSGTSNGWIADGFVKLGRYDRSLQLKLQDYVVQNSQYYAAMAVNAARLSTPGEK